MQQSRRPDDPLPPSAADPLGAMKRYEAVGRGCVTVMVGLFATAVAYIILRGTASPTLCWTALCLLPLLLVLFLRRDVALALTEIDALKATYVTQVRPSRLDPDLLARAATCYALLERRAPPVLCILIDQIPTQSERAIAQMHYAVRRGISRIRVKLGSVRAVAAAWGQEH